MKCQFYFLSYVDAIFSCLKMYSEKFFNAYFYEQMFFFEILWKRETQVTCFFKNNSLNI